MSHLLKALVVTCVGIAACQEEPIKHTHKPLEAPAVKPGVQIDSAKLSMFSALPARAPAKSGPASPEQIALGQELYYDARLSKAQDLACNSCHDLDKSGADGEDFSTGHGKKKLTRNTPTVLNAAFAPSLGWDGRFETVEDATRAMLQDPTIMAGVDTKIIDTLKSIPEYVDAFKKAYPALPDPVTLDGAVNALGAFVRTLSTPSRWDKFLAGDASAVTDDEKNGFTKFVDLGCPTCHVGPLVGTTMMQKLGKEKPWPNTADKGRSAVTHSPSDDMMFRVSQLRNIEHTAPYFHDASGKTLPEAIKTMAAFQLAKTPSDDEVKSVAAWFATLSGTVPADAAKKPAPYASTAKTPKPDRK